MEAIPLSATEYRELVDQLTKQQFVAITPPEWVTSHWDWHRWCCEVTWSIPALESRRQFEEITTLYRRYEELRERGEKETEALLSRVTELNQNHWRFMQEHWLPKQKRRPSHL